jgi:hypothetical protein
MAANFTALLGSTFTSRFFCDHQQIAFGLLTEDFKTCTSLFCPLPCWRAGAPPLPPPFPSVAALPFIATLHNWRQLQSKTADKGSTILVGGVAKLKQMAKCPARTWIVPYMAPAPCTLNCCSSINVQTPAGKLYQAYML